jgi:hypothetical protein
MIRLSLLLIIINHKGTEIIEEHSEQHFDICIYVLLSALSASVVKI